MADQVSVKIEGDGVDTLKLIGKAGAADQLLLREAIRDIAEVIERTAKKLAPIGETGELHEHPVDVKEGFGEATGSHLFGGGFAIRGATGFVPGRAESGEIGKEVSHIEISLPRKPKYARWVHEGTGVFVGHDYIRPTHGRYMKFRYQGKRFRLTKVKGQPAQPYLTTAYQVVDKGYVPERIERLKLQISTLYR